MSSDGYEGGLISRDQHDEMDAAVRTLAEHYFECGFTPERALDIAWAVAKLPEAVKALEDEF